MPCSSLRARNRALGRTSGKETWTRATRGQRERCPRRRILTAQPSSPRISRMSTNPDHKVKLSPPAVVLGLCPLPGSASRGQVRGGGSGRYPRPQPLGLCNQPGMGRPGASPTRGMRRLGPGTLEKGAAPGGGGRGGGGWEDCRPAPRDRPRAARAAAGLTQSGGGARATERCGGGRAVWAARPALPARRASTTGGGSGC